VWVIPGMLLLPPTYQRAHFNASAARNKLTPLVGNDSSMPITQDLKISRLDTDAAGTYEYKLASGNHGIYAFVVEGSMTCNGVSLGKRDSTGIWETDKVTFQTGAERSDILIVETIM